MGLPGIIILTYWGLHSQSYPKGFTISNVSAAKEQWINLFSAAISFTGIPYLNR